MNKSPTEIMTLLSEKFNSNFREWQGIKDNKLDKVIFSIFTLNTIAEILNKKKKSVHHDVCIKIFNEIIADTSSSLYLSACAIDKPAKIVLRRVLELGVASIYLWDMPHIVYSWKNHDEDLSFSDMLKHITNQGYIDYFTENEKIDGKVCVIDTKKAQRIYGELSDVVHGKITSFETDLPNKFTFEREDWERFIELVEVVLGMVINSNIVRHGLKKEVLSSFPKSSEVIF